VDALSPQEDEFALLTLGVDSAYRAFWMPHRLNELQHTLDPAHWLANDSWLHIWVQFLERVLRSGQQAHQPLLLKSPNHSFRLAAIQRHWPGTRVVWMLRDGTAVAHSNLKMWRSMFQLYGLTPPVPGSLETFIAQALHACAKTLDAAPVVPGNHLWALVSQARLRDDAAAVVHEVQAQLELPGDIDQAALQTAIARTHIGREERYTSALPDSMQSAVQVFDAAQHRALHRYGAQPINACARS
jgi:omega-hydroxy-beta-dihydromenaquinone-9 sulfotransferase